MKKIIAGVMIAIPLMMTTFGTKADASQGFVNKSIRPIASRPEFIARAKHRVLVPGRWEYRNHRRVWVKAHYEWRY
ncbi:hypothetical protein G7B40_024695 [Aetokthonos hydrillicola Thurmond2011]|uniref:Uncharacterized protein n=1 Tax=Aetokthonos hydrillicola Thurmond2011 TaxID=2712845 RepID=A0AAP5MA10_9CYAN|nr:hypothetical protein [Aetokthonos hydrillicola]MBO3461563.1 hypothetical protein [Aetokthonos hydrillicola CCALA 1050]MBW4586135.1 hypothetical protein [Aetokthonos hydrillicola CCALA 1050]MDR9897740.1 hypothetical protein [Aetokthonos hydrillicola Thurmond2011]